jgi:hypothetical protein
MWRPCHVLTILPDFLENKNTLPGCPSFACFTVSQARAVSKHAVNQYVTLIRSRSPHNATRIAPNLTRQSANMDLRKPFVGSLKIILDSKKPDICPTLSEDQARQVPPKLLKELFRDFSPDDLGDLGTLVQVLDKKWHGTLTKMVQWIRKGEAADFLNEKEPYVRRPDRECQAITCEWICVV